MKAKIAERLLTLNHQFYTDFGDSFSATRSRLQPGVRTILASLRGDETILDLGCGNGGLARALASRGHRGAYLGLDFSLSLLREANSLPEGFSAKFVEMDMTKLSMSAHQLPIASGGSTLNEQWSLITAFATLHHIPSHTLRLQLLQTVQSLLAPHGRFIHSNWQFLNSPRLRGRIRPWSEIGLTQEDVDPGDYLLDWRAGGHGLRYVHYFAQDELAALAASSGFEIVETFYSDGKEGNLAVYQTWEKARQHRIEI